MLTETEQLFSRAIRLLAYVGAKDPKDFSEVLYVKLRDFLKDWLKKVRTKDTKNNDICRNLGTVAKEEARDGRR